MSSLLPSRILPATTSLPFALNGEGLRLVERAAEVGDEPSVAGERGVEVTARSQPDQGPLVAPTCCGAAGEDEVAVLDEGDGVRTIASRRHVHARDAVPIERGVEPAVLPRNAPR